MSDWLGRYTVWGARRAPDRIAIQEFGGSHRTYRQLDQRTTKLANALLGSGLKPGDRIAAWLEDVVEYVELYHAVAKAGIMMVPINALFTASEADFILENSGSRRLFSSESFAERIGNLTATDGLDGVVEVRSSGNSSGVFDSDYEEFLAGGRETAHQGFEGSAPFLLGYTSGTTGFPKGVIVTHSSASSIARMNALSYHLPLSSTAAFSGTMSFVAGVPAILFSHWHVGGTVLLVGKWTPDKLFDAIQQHRATFSYFPASEIKELTLEGSKTPEKWQTLDGILQSAAKANPGHMEEAASVFGSRFVMGWGMTENSGGLFTATTRADFAPGCEALDLYASAGRATADAMVEVVDASGNPVRHDGTTVGELIGQSPALMQGYWKNEEATAKALRNGWYWSGDMGSIDPAGYIYVAGRSRDMIVSGGMNVYPGEIERIIGSMPSVKEVAVVGAPHPRWGQTPAAFIVRREAQNLSEEDVLNECKQHLASYKKPTKIIFVDDFPRTTSGKIQKNILEEGLRDA